MTDLICSLHTMRSDGSLNLRHILDRCRKLRANLGEYIAATDVAAPIRQSGFELSRPEAFVSRAPIERGWQLPESALERELWSRWKRDVAIKREFLPGYCHFIQCYQFPLKESHKDAGWGKIDLLGVAPDSMLPVVIELKATNAGDPLHQVIVEGVAYAIAIRKTWRESKGLRKEWADCLNLSMEALPEELPTIKVVCLAPSMYWKRSFSNGRTSGRIPDAAREEIRSLISDLLAHGFEVILADFLPDKGGPARLIRIPPVKESS
jgi:hypothetical protein